jgi:hypothetical protein
VPGRCGLQLPDTLPEADWLKVGNALAAADPGTDFHGIVPTNPASRNQNPPRRLNGHDRLVTTKSARRLRQF